MTMRITILAGAAIAVLAAPCALAQDTAVTPPADTSIVTAPTATPAAPAPTQTPAAAPAPSAMPDATPPAPAAPKMRGDANGDGFVSKDEFMAPHEKRFQKIDTNSDGKISPDEKQAFDDMMAAKAAEKKAGEPAADAATGDKKPSFFSRFFD